MWLGWSHHFKRFTITTITRSTATEYLCYKWPRICSTCRNHNPVLSTFMTYQVSNKSNTMGATCETETFSLLEHTSWPQVFNEVRIAWSVVFCGVFCRLFFVSFLLAKGLFVRLWFFGFWLPDLYLQNVLTIHQCSYNSCLQDRVWIILQRARYILVNYHTILKIWYH
jgi:hypothetical protein